LVQLGFRNRFCSVPKLCPSAGPRKHIHQGIDSVLPRSRPFAVVPPHGFEAAAQDVGYLFERGATAEQFRSERMAEPWKTVRSERST